MSLQKVPKSTIIKNNLENTSRYLSMADSQYSKRRRMTAKKQIDYIKFICLRFLQTT